jgi:RNA recognition motif-containing protein
VIFFLLLIIFNCMNIYVGNLNYRVREHDLQQALEEFGTVSSVKVVMDRDTGRSKGFGFVEMPNDQEAAEAIRKLNGQDFQGRTIVIKEARPKY